MLVSLLKTCQYRVSQCSHRAKVALQLYSSVYYLLYITMCPASITSKSIHSSCDCYKHTVYATVVANYIRVCIHSHMLLFSFIHMPTTLLQLVSFQLCCSPVIYNCSASGRQIMNSSYEIIVIW